MLGQSTPLNCSAMILEKFIVFMKTQYINCFEIPESNQNQSSPASCLYSGSKFGPLFKHLPEGFPLGPKEVVGSVQAGEGSRQLQVKDELS